VPETGSTTASGTLDQGVEACLANRQQIGKAFQTGAGGGRRGGHAGALFGQCRLIGAVEGPQARRHAKAGRSDRRLIGRAGERQGAGCRQGTEQGCGDDALRLLGDRRHVEGQELLAGRACRLIDLDRIAGAVARHGLLDHRVGAVRRGNERRPIGRDETALNGAAGFHQLGADHDIDLAGHRHQ